MPGGLDYARWVTKRLDYARWVTKRIDYARWVTKRLTGGIHEAKRYLHYLFHNDLLILFARKYAQSAIFKSMFLSCSQI